MTVWFAMKPMSTFFPHVFLFFFFFQPTIVDFVNCEQCICVLFTIPQIILFSNFFIKNGSHNTIYTFKNYFVTVFSVLVFNFSKNKLNPNTPIVSDGFRFLEKQQNFTNKIEEIIVYFQSIINAYSLLLHEWWVTLIKFMVDPLTIHVKGGSTHLLYSEST